MKIRIRIGTKWKGEIENMTRNVRTVDKCGEKSIWEYDGNGKNIGKQVKELILSLFPFIIKMFDYH